jgi:hypothetical protein
VIADRKFRHFSSSSSIPSVRAVSAVTALRFFLKFVFVISIIGFWCRIPETRPAERMPDPRAFRFSGFDAFPVSIAVEIRLHKREHGKQGSLVQGGSRAPVEILSAEPVVALIACPARSIKAAVLFRIPEFVFASALIADNASDTAHRRLNISSLDLK